MDIVARHNAFIRAAPPSRELQVIGDALELGRVVEVTRLVGGLESAVHRVAYERATVVTRRFNEARGWHPPERVRGEAAVLRALAATDIPAPRLLFVDDDGSTVGCPVIVQSLLPGAPMAPVRTDPDAMGQLVAVARMLHASPPIGPAQQWQRSWLRPEPDAMRRRSPLGESCWEAIVSAREELRAEEQVMCHNDLHPGNTLWENGSLVGVVDWSSAGPGFAGADAGYCAGDLWLSLGEEAADAFLAAWREQHGEALHPGWLAVGAWDLLLDAPLLVTPYGELAMPVTIDLLEQRLAEIILRARSELGLPAA